MGWLANFHRLRFDSVRESEPFRVFGARYRKESPDTALDTATGVLYGFERTTRVESKTAWQRIRGGVQ